MNEERPEGGTKDSKRQSDLTWERAHWQGQLLPAARAKLCEDPSLSGRTTSTSWSAVS